METERGRRSIPERIARGYAAAMVDRVAFFVLLMVLIPVVLALAVLIFAVLGVVLFGAYAVLGPLGLPYAPVGIGWFVGSLVILFLVLRRGHRWLTRLVEIAAVPAALIDPEIDEVVVREPFDEAAFQTRVAAADSRHSPPSATHDDP